MITLDLSFITGILLCCAAGFGFGTIVYEAIKLILAKRKGQK